MEVRKLNMRDYVLVTGLTLGCFGTEYQKAVRIERMLPAGIVDHDGDSYGERNIFPLEMTDRMLEDSGFDKYVDGDLTTLFRQKDDETGNEIYNINVYRRSDEDMYTVEITNHGTGGHGEYAEMKKFVFGVHEFQHALRECGLEEIGDNLKILEENG